MELPWRLIKSLSTKKGRQKNKLTVVEGPGPCSVGLSTQVQTRFLVMTDDFAKSQEGQVVRNMVSQLPERPDTFVVDDSLFYKMAGTESPQGVLLVVPIPFKFYTERPKAFWKKELIVTGVDIQDPGNVGTIIRTASGCGATSIVLSEGSADPFSPKVIRSSAGAVFKIQLIQVDDHLAYLSSMKDSGVKLVKTSPVSGLKPWEMDFTQDVALLFGNEGSGLGKDVMDLPGCTVSLPMPGGTESLNVASSASMLLYEALRQRLKGPRF